MSTIPPSVTLAIPLMLHVEGKWFNLSQATVIDTEPRGGGLTIEFAIPLPVHTGRTTRCYRLTGSAADAVRDWLEEHSHGGLLYAPARAESPHLNGRNGHRAAPINCDV